VSVLAWLLVLAAIGSAIDVLGVDQRADVFYSVTATFAQFLLTSMLLMKAGRHDAWGKPGRAASFVGVCIVSGLVIMLGLFLLVLPGLYMAARWMLVCPLVIGRGMTMGEALRESWERTAGHVMPLMAALAAVFVSGFGGFAVVTWFAYPAYGPVSPLPAVSANLLVSGALVLGWCVAVGAYLALAPDQSRAAMPEGDTAAA
jgi:hypothetical protein